MKKTIQDTNINLDELFAGARTEEPVINIDEARSILHTKAGQPHAPRPAHESLFSQPLKLFAIMTPAIGLLCLGLYLYLGKPMEQKQQLNKLSEARPHTAAKSVSAYADNTEESTSPIVTDTLRVKKRMVIKDDKNNSGEKFRIINIESDTVIFQDSIFTPNKLGFFYKDEILVDKDLKFDTLKLKSIRNLRTISREEINKQLDSIRRISGENRLLIPGGRFRNGFNKNHRDILILKQDVESAQLQVDSFMKAVHPQLKNYTNNLVIGDKFTNPDSINKQLKVLYKFDGITNFPLEDGKMKTEPMQIRVYVDKNEFPARVESEIEYKTDSQNVRIITLKSGKDLKNISEFTNTVSSPASIKFLELDDATLNKLGIVYNDYKILYHGEINKLNGAWKSALTFALSPCFPPCDKKTDTSITSTYAMKTHLKSVKRDFFPIFTSDRTGTTFHALKFDNKKLTNRAEFLKQANSLVPVIVKTNRKTFNMEDVVFWFSPSDEFFKILPDSIGRELSIEYKKLNQNNDLGAAASTDKKLFKENKDISTEGTGENCKYFEVCRTNSGAISNSLIYPNPASAQFNLMLVLQEPRNIKISLLDIQGKLIKELAPSALKTGGRHQLSFNLDDINRGVYLVLIESDQAEQSIQRLVVDK